MTLISRLVFFTKKKTPQKSSETAKAADISIVIPVKDNQKGIDNFFVNFFKTHSKNKFPKEIIVVCNNSNVKTKIRQEFLEEFSNIQVFECKKLGPASARNMGVQQPAVTSTIIGAKTVAQLNDNIASVNVQLSAEDLKKIDQISPLPLQYPGWMVARQSDYRK